MKTSDDRPGDLLPLGPPKPAAPAPAPAPAEPKNGIVTGPDGKLSTSLPGPWGENR